MRGKRDMLDLKGNGKINDCIVKAIWTAAGDEDYCLVDTEKAFEAVLKRIDEADAAKH